MLRSLFRFCWHASPLMLIVGVLGLAVWAMQNPDHVQLLVQDAIAKLLEVGRDFYYSNFRRH